MYAPGPVEKEEEEEEEEEEEKEEKEKKEEKKEKNNGYSYIILLLHFLIYSLMIGTLSEICGCFHICYNINCVSTGYILVIAHSISTKGMSHLKILVNKVFTVSLCFIFANIPTSFIPDLFAKTTSNVIYKII